ncbi:MAG: aminopeptidase P family protein [Pelovirga sp.]
MSDKQQLIHQLLTTESLDALLVFGRADLRYFCGFSGTDGVLFISPHRTVFLTDSRYQEQARQEVAADEVRCYKGKFEALAKLIEETGCRQVAFDARQLCVSEYLELQRQCPSAVTFSPLVEQCKPLRGIKEPAEIACLKQAADLNRRAFSATLPSIRSGVRERDIALELEFNLKKMGGEVNAFDFIVASGLRGALPHGVASDKLIMKGDLVTIDFGTRLGGYHSDETVTLAIGPVAGKLRQIFDIVLEAHDSAMAAARSGMRACELDAVARDLITQRGYGDYFGHGLGHGVGLEVHEYPTLTGKSETVLKSGMVVTIEPGIYVPELGGVRIEDTILITDEGHECLTSIPKQYCQLSS